MFGLLGVNAAVNDQHFAIDKAGSRTQQEQDRPSHVLRLGHAFHRDTLAILVGIDPVKDLFAASAAG